MSAVTRWAAFAAEDMAMAEAAQGLGLWNQVCLHAQQAAAKSLKAFLAERNRSIPVVHHLAELLALCAEADHSLSRFEDRCYTLEDRKSTRLNSSHGYISYAVFCLK